MPAPRKIDWFAVEPDYRAGVMSIDAVAQKHGASASAVRKEAKLRGWTRNVEGLKAERVRAMLAGASEGADESVEGVISAEAERDARVMRTSADFFETVLTTMSERFSALTSVTDQKKATETAVLATTMYRKIRGLDDRPQGKSIEDMLGDL